LLSTYSQAEIKSSKVKMKLLKDMNVAGFIAEYFVDLQANSLSMHTHQSMMTFLLDLAEEKEYRSYMVNKALFVYLNECFTNKDCNKKLKSQISELIASVASAINPNSLSYPLQYFVVDILCHTLQDNTKELYIFESQLA
jgi:uncharacterized membrane-anchored protein YjiN (DUF445 family)